MSASFSILKDVSDDYERMLDRRGNRIVELEAALQEAIDGWASYLDVCPNIKGRKRLDEVRAILDRR